MAYYRFTRLQQYINGQPTDTYTKGERVDDVDYSTYETCMGGSGNSRWVSIPQTVCYNGDLWSMEKEQISYDGGVTWIDTTNTRRVSVIEPSASQCSGADNDWRVVYGEYICNGTTKCLKEAEYIGNSPTGRTRAGSIVELLSEDCGVMYQWVNVPGEYVCVFKCGRGDKYTKQKQQYSLDNGVHWEDTGETREGDFVEKNSSYCGCDTSVTRWVTVSGEYVCVGTSKYTKEKEQSSTDGTNWTDTGNTRAGSLIEASSSSCASTRWVTVSGQYSCVGTDKYNLEKEQQSTDGENWTDTGNTRAGSTLIEANSTDCGYVPPSTTRWVEDTGYMCVGTDKYNKEKEQISYDSGSTWTDTGNTKAGSTLIEHDSEDCPSMTCCEFFESFDVRCWPQRVIQATEYTRCIQDSTDGSTNYKSGYSFYARKHTTNYGLTYYVPENFYYYLITGNGRYSGSIYNATQATQAFHDEYDSSTGEVVSTTIPIAYDENIYTVNIVGLKDKEQAPSDSNIAFYWSRFGRDGWYEASTDAFVSSTFSLTKKDNSTITAECTTGGWQYTCDINPVTKVVSNVKAYRWVEDTGYVCTGYDKYNKEKEQMSTDGGEHWTDTGITRAGSTLIETNSTDCSRWVADTGYMCVGIDKYNKEKEQITTDGTNWTDTGNTRAGSTLIETCSTDCGFDFSGNLPCYIEYFSNFKDAENFAESDSDGEVDCGKSFASWKKWVCDSKSSSNSYYNDGNYYHGYYYANYLSIDSPTVKTMAHLLFPECESWEEFSGEATPSATNGEYKRGTFNRGYMNNYFMNTRLNDDSIKDKSNMSFSNYPNTSGKTVEWVIYHFQDKYVVTKIIENVEYKDKQFVLKTCPEYDDITINLERIAHRRGYYATSDTENFVEYE